MIRNTAFKRSIRIPFIVLGLCFGIHLSFIIALKFCDRPPLPEIHQAVNNRNYEKIKNELNQDIEVEDIEFNETCIHWAVSNGDLKMVKLLVELGVNINQAGWRDQTPLDSAEYIGNTEIITYLKENGAKHFKEL